MASAAPGHWSSMRKTSPTAFEVKQKNGDICMCLGCFAEASKLKLLCVHSWESCITVPDCYCIRLPQIHSGAPSQVPNSISESYWCCLQRSRIWIQRHQLPSFYLQSVSILHPPHCACCRHFASTVLPHVTTAFAWKKTTFLSSTLKGINRLKNYCRRKTILAFKMWWQPTNGQEIKHQGGKLQLYSVGTCKYLLL